MKKFILPAFAFVLALSSCKKDDPAPSTCDATVAAIAGNYKITKYEGITSAGTFDLTSTAFDACDLGGVYQFKSDKTVTYAESGAGCSGTDTGIWDVVSGKITTSVYNLDFVNNDVSNGCSKIVVTIDAGGGNKFITTMTKQ